jgi:4'-phosphopantetheinyl transferase
MKADSLPHASAPRLESGELHLWEFPLTASEASFTTYSALLSSDECTRASRFHFDRDARRFTIARGVVRTILGAYLHAPAGDLNFTAGKNGKPALANPGNLRFNVSHSSDLALLGVALEREIGVDVEAIRPDVETDKLAERFFSVHERESIRALPQPERVSAFFRCWTCKEAFLKGQGVGLSRSLESFDVEVNSKLPAKLLATRPDAAEARDWVLHDIETAPGYAAAVAAQPPLTAIRILRCH